MVIIMTDANEIADKLIKDHLEKKSFSVTTLELSEATRSLWVRIRVDPNEFRKKMFDGNWSVPEKHPDLGSIRILRILTGNDGITRAIGRQGDFLYAYPD